MYIGNLGRYRSQTRKFVYSVWRKCPHFIKVLLRRSALAKKVMMFLLDHATKSKARISNFTETEERQILDSVDVIITSFNQSNFIKEALESVMAQSFNVARIIVVNHSAVEEESLSIARIIQEFGSENVQHFDIAECWPGTARNFGASVGESSLLLFLDADDYISPDYVLNAVFFLNLLGVDFVGAWCQNFSDFERRSFGAIWKTEKDPNWKNLVSTNAFPVSSVIKREMFASVGGWVDYDNSNQRQDEAIDFWRRCVIANFRGINLQQKMIFLRRHSHNLSDKSHELPFFQNDKIKKSWVNLLQQKNINERDLLIDDSAFRGNVNALDLILRESGSEKECALFLIPDKTFFGAGKVIKWTYNQCRSDFSVVLINCDIQGVGGNIARELEQSTARILEIGAYLNLEDWAELLEKIVLETKATNIMSFGHPFANAILGTLRDMDFHPKTMNWMFNTKSANAEWLAENPDSIDKVFVESEKSVMFLTRAGWQPNRIVKVSHNAHRFSDPSAEVPKVRNQGKEISILWFGRMADEKRPELFFKLAQAIKSKHTLVFTISGEGPLKDRTKDQAYKSAVTVEFSEVSSERLMAEHHLLVSTSSEVEGRPLTIIEALELGMIVFAPNSGSINEIQDDGYIGLYLYDDFSEIQTYIDNIVLEVLHRERDYRIEHNRFISNQRETQHLFI